MKRITIFILLIGLAAAGLWLAPEASTTTGNGEVTEPLESGFKLTGADFHELSVSGWAKVNQRFMPEEEISQAAWQVAKDLGMNQSGSDANLNVQQDKGFRGVNIQGKIGDYAVGEVYYQSLYPEETKEAETYITVVITVNNHEKTAGQWTKLVKAAISTQGQPEVAATIMGTLNGRLTLEQRQSLANKVFKQLRAKKLEGIEDKEVLSWTGYSPYIKETLSSSTEKINLNLALRYNPTIDKSYIIIGSPIIAVEY